MVTSAAAYRCQPYATNVQLLNGPDRCELGGRTSVARPVYAQTVRIEPSFGWLAGIWSHKTCRHFPAVAPMRKGENEHQADLADLVYSCTCSVAVRRTKYKPNKPNKGTQRHAKAR